jgi:hypothetical protein
VLRSLPTPQGYGSTPTRENQQREHRTRFGNPVAPAAVAVGAPLVNPKAHKQRSVVGGVLAVGDLEACGQPALMANRRVLNIVASSTLMRSRPSSVGETMM